MFGTISRRVIGSVGAVWMALAVLVPAAIAPAARGQDLGHKAPPQQSPIVLMNATVHPVSGPAIENGVVVFSEGVISLVADATLVRLASFTPDTKMVDASGLHVYPGLICAETRLGLIETPSVRATVDVGEVGEFAPEVRAAVAVNPDSTLIPVARSNGVLIAGVMPDGGVVAGRASVMRLEGWTWEDMTIEADAGLVLAWPGVRPVRAWWNTESEEAQLGRVRERLEAIDRVFDSAAAYGEARRADSAAPVDLRYEAMLPVIRGEKPVIIQAEEHDQIVSALTWAERRGLRVILYGGRDAPLCAPLLLRREVPVIVPGVHRFPRRDDQGHDEAFSLPARLRDAGITFCISTEDRDGNTRNLPYEAATAARYGLTVDEAIRSITLSAAEVLGIDERYGSLERGKSATLIVTDGNPLEVRTNVVMAFIDGRTIDLTNKQTELLEKYAEKYRQLGLIK